MKELLKKLSSIQSELKVPKNQHNKFGNYNFRSAEDILEAAKPICKKYNAVLLLTDTMVAICERYYVKSTAILFDTESEEHIEVDGYAREPHDKKGMDESQITGSASSYARKYALNGLFDIDDAKDADTNEYKETQLNKEKADIDKFKAEVKADEEKTKKEKPKPIEYKCTVCGKPFVDYKDKNGKTWTPEEQYNSVGGLCHDCRIKKKQEEQSNA